MPRPASIVFSLLRAPLSASIRDSYSPALAFSDDVGEFCEFQPTVAKRVDPKLHRDAVKLVELSGAKQYLQDNLAKMIDEGKKVMMDKCPACTPEFGEEWKKRFLERANINDFLDVYVRAYEKYFTDAEINELIALQKDKTAAPSPALKEKLTSVMPEFMADIIGDCSKVGAKLGGEIGTEIEREHREYMRPPADSTKPNAR